MISPSRSQLTVVIPTWNGRDLLRNCLRSLQHQTHCVEVLVVDNGSEDGTIAMLGSEFPAVRCLRLEENKGFAQAANAGIESSSSPIVALLNNDTEVDPGWVQAGLKALNEYPQAGFVASRMICFHNRRLLDSAGDCYSPTGMPFKRGLGQDPDRYTEREWVLGASAGAAFYRRSVLEDVGLLDEDFYMYLEDVEWSLRANLLGHRCLYVPDAVVYHIEAASDPELGTKRTLTRRHPQTLYSDRRVYWITRNRWQLMVIYQSWHNGPLLIFGWVKSYCFHLLKAGHSLPFLKGLLAGIRRTLRCRTKRKQFRKRARLSRSEWRQRMRECSRSV